MAQTIWQEAEAKHVATNANLLAHLEVCQQCAGLVSFCAEGQQLIDGCARAPKLPAGVEVIKAGQCPMEAKGALGCTFCTFGHLTECHFPNNCRQANCSHLHKYERGE